MLEQTHTVLDKYGLKNTIFYLSSDNKKKFIINYQLIFRITKKKDIICIKLNLMIKKKEVSKILFEFIY